MSAATPANLDRAPNTRRPLGQLVLTILVLAAAAAGLAQSGVSDPQEAREFVLVNERGEARATLRLEQDLPLLELFDKAGHVRLRLGLTDEGPVLMAQDSTGEARDLFSVQPRVVPTR